MMFSKIFLATLSVSCLLLAGCTAPSQFRPSTVDGKDYFAGVPQIAVGTLEEIRVTEKNGTVHSFAAGAGSVAGEMGVSGKLLTDLGGMSSAGAGAVAGGLGAVFDIISAASAPTVEFWVRRDPQGDLINVPVNSNDVKVLRDYRCTNLGDKVRVVLVSRRLQVYNWVPELVRVSDFQPNCRKLRAAAGLPNPPVPD